MKYILFFLLSFFVHSNLAIAKSESDSIEIFVEVGEEFVHYIIEVGATPIITRTTHEEKVTANLSKENLKFINKKIDGLANGPQTVNCYRNQFKIRRQSQKKPIKWQSCWGSNETNAVKMLKFVKTLDLLFP